METDDALCQRLQRGDLAAFDALYARYERPLYGFIRSYLNDSAEAEDVFHEAFMQVLRNQKADLSRFRGWVYQTARNLCLNRLRARNRGEQARLQLVEARAPSPEKQFEDRATAHALERAVGELPNALSEIFHLRASGMSYEEMAEVLELPLGTVKSRMHEMVHQLRKDLRPWTAR
jgi:RNA polymerase sigma-70 factor, ECF subfamily